jgi:hypothetical protein
MEGLGTSIDHTMESWEVETVPRHGARRPNLGRGTPDIAREVYRPLNAIPERPPIVFSRVGACDDLKPKASTGITT